MAEKKNKGGRPTKLTEDHVRVFQNVVNDWILYAGTNEELFIMYNDYLEKEKLSTISYRTFQGWKNEPQKADTHKEYLRIIKKALLKQKQTLMSNLKTEDKAWQKWAWIIERKFSDWNLKQISETKADVKVNFPEFIIKKGDDTK